MTQKSSLDQQARPAQGVPQVGDPGLARLAQGPERQGPQLAVSTYGKDGGYTVEEQTLESRGPEQADPRRPHQDRGHLHHRRRRAGRHHQHPQLGRHRPQGRRPVRPLGARGGLLREPGPEGRTPGDGHPRRHAGDGRGSSGCRGPAGGRRRDRPPRPHQAVPDPPGDGHRTRPRRPSSAGRGLRGPPRARRGAASPRSCGSSPTSSSPPRASLWCTASPRAHPQGAQARHRLPGLGPAALAHGEEQHQAPARGQRAQRSPTRTSPTSSSSSGSESFDQRPAVAAVGRHAPAGGHRPGAGRRPRGAAARRAVRRRSTR